MLLAIPIRMLNQVSLGLGMDFALGLPVQGSKGGGMLQERPSIYSLHQRQGSAMAVLVEAIIGDIYRKPRDYGFRHRSDASDAIARYLPRIERSIQRYQDTGSSFETYLSVCLRYMLINMYRQRIDQADEAWVIKEFLAGYSDYEEAALDESRPMEMRRRIQALRRGFVYRRSFEAFRQRVFFLCAKNAMELNDQEVRDIALSLDGDPEELVAKVQRLRVINGELLERRQRRLCDANQCWMSMHIQRRRLSRQVDPYRRDQAERRIRRLENRYANLRSELRVMRRVIPNGSIAEVFGVPKGTVDSGLKRLRAYCDAHLAAADQPETT